MRYLSIIILIIVFTSCKNSATKNNSIETFYSTGELMISGDTIGNRLVGKLNYFDKNGDTISSQNWTNGHFVNELDYYDNNLINFYRKCMLLQLDSILHENKNHKLEIINFPEHILSIASNNGKIIYQNEQWLITPETSQKKLNLRLYAKFDGEIKEILLVEKTVEKQK